MNLVVGSGVPAEGMPSAASPPAAIRPLRTRPACVADREVLHGIGARLVSFGLPRWRDPRRTRVADIEAIEQALGSAGDRNMLLVAEDSAPMLLGFIQVAVTRDARRGVPVAQVIRIVVVADRDPQVIGRTLLHAAQRWAMHRGCVAITCAPLWASRIADQPSSVAPGTSHSETLAIAVPIAVAASTSLG